MVLLVAALAATSSGAHAQLLTGRLIAGDTNQPIEAAVVHLLRGEVRLGSSYTSVDGSFALRVPEPGRYALRAERIGFETVTSAELDVPDEGLRYTFVMPVHAVRLDAIVVESKQQCRPTREAAEVATVWEEARKALDAVALTERDELVRSAIVSFERDLDAATLAPTREIERVRAVRSRVPIRSLPAEDLAQNGYVRVDPAAIDWYAPDADVLLSDSFLATHCFQLRADANRPERIGLAFSPVLGSRPDIEGVLWLDRVSAELRDLEYRYTRLPWEVLHDGIGGYVAFGRVEGGPWIVREWFIRMPLLQRSVLHRGAVRIASFRQTGSEVVDIVQALDRRRPQADVAAPATAPPPVHAVAAGTDSTPRTAAGPPAPPDSVYALEGITVEAEARLATLDRQGFYTRMRTNVGGDFLTPERIEQRNPRRPSDLLESIPGARLRPVRQGYGRVLWFGGSERPGGNTGITLCGPRVYVDDLLIFQGGTTLGPAPIDELVNVHDIAGVEVYRGSAEVPAQYAGAESACGVLLIWTGPRTRDP